MALAEVQEAEVVVGAAADQLNAALEALSKAQALRPDDRDLALQRAQTLARMMMKTASTWPQRIFAADNDHAPSRFGGMSVV